MARRFHRLFAFTVTALSAACSATQPRPAPPPSVAPCPPGSLETSEQVRRFASCSAVTGDLAVLGTNLVDLRALSNLARVEGALVIADNPNLENLSGLERLTVVGRLEIRNNRKLYELRGLDGLEEVDELVVLRNRSLISLSGLSNVRRAGEVKIHENPRLCGRLGLLPRLEHVERGLSVTKNWGLTKGEVSALHERVRHYAALPPGDSDIALSKQ
jgi:hypothetical protein